MRMCVISFFLCFFCCLPLSAAGESIADSTDINDSLAYYSLDGSAGNITNGKYDKRINHYRETWEKLIPTHFLVQGAGNMGLLSTGIGWGYGKRTQWETQMMVGFVPKYNSPRAKVTLTLKENYIPFSIYVKEGWQFEPLRCGLYANSVIGHEFWGHQPNRYPNGYYWVSTRMRLNIFVGQGVTKLLPYNKRKFVKSLTAFYEISSCDLYLRSKFISHDISLMDIIGLSLGVKMSIF